MSTNSRGQGQADLPAPRFFPAGDPIFLKQRKRGKRPDIESRTMSEKEHQRAEIRTRVTALLRTHRDSPDEDRQVEQAVMGSLDDPLSDDFIVFNSARSSSQAGAKGTSD
jgi:hypothetical protein